MLQLRIHTCSHISLMYSIEKRFIVIQSNEAMLLILDGQYQQQVEGGVSEWTETQSIYSCKKLTTKRYPCKKCVRFQRLIKWDKLLIVKFCETFMTLISNIVTASHHNGIETVARVCIDWCSIICLDGFGWVNLWKWVYFI